MPYDFIGQIFTNNILKHIEAFIQKCSMQIWSKTLKNNVKAQNASPEQLPDG